jgi:hypothetical protein
MSEQQCRKLTNNKMASSLQQAKEQKKNNK